MQQPFKRYFLFIQVFCLVACALYSPKAKASHAAGGELIYEWVADSTYRFIFKFYRDCTGAAEAQSINFCGSNSCNSSWDISLQLQKSNRPLPDGRVNGSPIVTGCPQYPTKCANISSQQPGYKEWWYEDTIKLPGNCHDWKFAVSLNARNPSANTNNVSGGNLYLEATLNSKLFGGNSSPSFTILPLPYMCVNSPYTYNNGAIDVDGDSLTTEIIRPQNTMNCKTAPLYVPISTGISFPNNPLSCGNTFIMSNTTGQFSFTPDLVGAHTLTTKVSEYRNGKLIGYVLRDVQMQVLACTTPQIDGDLDKKSLANASVINNVITSDCGTKSIAFCFDIKADAKGTILKLSDNKSYSVPKATLVYTNQGTDSVRGCLTWTLTAADTGFKTLVIFVKDSTCKAPGISVSQAFSFPIKISPPDGAPLKVTMEQLADTVCQNAPLVVENTVTTNKPGTVYTWVLDSRGTSEGNNPYTLSWDTGGIHGFKLVATNGSCVAEDSGTVYVRGIPESYFEMIGDACLKQSITFSPREEEDASYHWTVQDGSIKDTSYGEREFSWTKDGWKKVTLKTSSIHNCGYTEYTDSIFVHNPPINITGVSKNTFCAGDTVALSTIVLDGAKYEWQPEIDFLTNDSSSVLYYGKYTTDVRVRVTDIWGCISEGSRPIAFGPCCRLTMPGAFSPNGDGKNDKFKFVEYGNYTMESMVVKNRWGNTVFETTDLYNGWDGSYKGRQADIGTYYYIIKYRCMFDKTVFTLSGDFVLVR